MTDTPFHHFIIPSFHHAIIESIHYVIMWSCDRCLVALSWCHGVIVLWSHSGILSMCQLVIRLFVHSLKVADSGDQQQRPGCCLCCCTCRTTTTCNWLQLTFGQLTHMRQLICGNCNSFPNGSSPNTQTPNPKPPAEIVQQPSSYR